MKKWKVILPLIIMVMVVMACGKSYNIGQFEGKIFQSEKGGAIFVGKNEIVVHDMLNISITPGMTPADLENIGKEMLKTIGDSNPFKNTKITTKNGASYIDADGLDKKIKIVDEKTLEDSNGAKYILMEIKK